MTWDLTIALREEIGNPDLFVGRLLSQYFAFTTRNPDVVEQILFAMVFRRTYGVEIENVDAETIQDDFKRQLDSARRQAAWEKGQGAEYKVQ